VELRHRIFRLLEEREQHGGIGIPTIGEIAEALGEPLRSVAVVLKSSEAMGMVVIHRYLGTDEADFTVMLKPPAFIYLEQQLNSGDR